MCPRNTQGGCSRLLVPPDGSWERAFSPPIKPTGSWSGCKGFITLFLSRPAATFNWTGQKLFTHGREIHFLFFKGNPAKSWISDGMSSRPQACNLSATIWTCLTRTAAFNKHMHLLTACIRIVRKGGACSPLHFQHRKTVHLCLERQSCDLFCYPFPSKQQSVTEFKFFVCLELPKSFFQKSYVLTGHRITEWPIVKETCFKITYISF